MTSPLARLTELGLVLPPVVAPLASYLPARRSGQFVFTAGQLPMVDGALPRTGLVGVDVSASEAAALARIAGLNALAAVDAVLRAKGGLDAGGPDAGGLDTGGLDAVAGVVKVVGYVACTAEFTGHPAVVNGASELFGEVFGESGLHARSAVGVASLPLGSPVEIELIVELA